MNVVPDHTVIDVDGLALDVNAIVTDAFEVFAEQLDSRLSPPEDEVRQSSRCTASPGSSSPREVMRREPFRHHRSCARPRLLQAGRARRPLVFIAPEPLEIPKFNPAEGMQIVPLCAYVACVSCRQVWADQHVYGTTLAAAILSAVPRSSPE